MHNIQSFFQFTPLHTISLRINRGRKKDMVSTIYHNKSKGSDAQNYLSNSSTVLEIKKLLSACSGLWQEQLELIIPFPLTIDKLMN